MRRLSINIVLLLTPFGLLVVLTVHIVHKVWTYLNSEARLAGVVSVEASRALGREVRIRNIIFKSSPWNLIPNRVDIVDIAVAQGSHMTSKPFASADRVSVTYSLKQLLFPLDPQSPLVSEVKVIHPRIRLDRDARGQWNFSQLLKVAGKGGRTFADKFTVENGTIFYTDRDLPRPPGVAARPFITQVDGLAGAALLGHDKNLTFDMNGRRVSGLVNQFHVVGFFDPHPLKVTVRVVASVVNMPTLSRYLLAPEKMRVLHGNADIDMSVLYNPASTISSSTLDIGAIEAQGSVRLSDVAVASSIAKLPITHMNGDLTFITDSLHANLVGQFAGTDFQVNGNALKIIERTGASRSTWTLASAPVFDVDGKFTHLDFSRLAHAVNLDRYVNRAPKQYRNDLLHAQAKGDLSFRIQGPLNDPIGTLSGQIESVRYSGYQARNLSVNAFYAGRKLDAGVHAAFAGGDITLRAKMPINDPEIFEAEIHGRNVQLAEFSRSIHTKLGGQGKVDAIARGRHNSLPAVTGQAEIDDLQVDNARLSSIYACVETQGNNLEVKTLRGEDDKGFVLAHGNIDLSTRQLNLDMEADELDIGAIAHSLLTRPPQTSVLLQKSRSQSVSSPKFFPEAFLFPGVAISDPEHKRTKSVALNSRSTDVKPLDLNDLQGVGYVRAHIGGTISDPQVSGAATAFALQLGKVGLDRLNSDFELNSHGITITKGKVERYPGSVSFQGGIDGWRSANARVEIKGKVDNADLTDLLHVSGVLSSKDSNSSLEKSLLVTGQLSTSEFEISGPLRKPVLTQPVTVTLINGTINGLPIGSTSAELTYDGDKLEVKNGNIGVAGGSITASGSIEIDPNFDVKLDFEVGAKDLNVQQLEAALPEGEVTDAKGLVAFNAHITGTPHELNVQATADANSVEYKDFAIGHIYGDIGYANQKIKISHVVVGDTNSVSGIPVNAAGQPGTITVDNLSYDMTDKRIEGAVRWDEMSLPILWRRFNNSAFAQTSSGKKVIDNLRQFTRTLLGTVSGTAELHGTTDAPVADITWNVQDLFLFYYRVSSIRGSATIDKNRVLIPSSVHPLDIVHLESTDATVEVSKFNVEYDGDIDADVSAYKVNLEFLRRWFKGGSAQDITGLGDIFFQVHGKTASPVVQASVNLSNLGFSGQKLDRVSIDNVIIEEPRIQFDTVEFAKDYVGADGKSARFTGKAHGWIDFSWKAPFISDKAALDLQADIPEHSLQVLSAFVPNLKLDTDGSFSISTRVSRTLDSPRIAGSVVVKASRMQFGNNGTGLANISGALDFSGDRVTIRNGFTAQSQVYRNGKPDEKRIGTPIVLTGSLPITDHSQTSGDEQIKLHAEHIYFEETPLPAIGSGSLRGEALADLTVSGALTKPTIGGDITLSNVQATPPNGLGVGGGGGISLPINPNFDLTIRLGKNIRVANSVLNARIDGFISLKGSLFATGEGADSIGPLVPSLTQVPVEASAAPRKLGLNVFGDLAIRDGILKLPTARFTIVPPGMLTLVYPYLDPSSPGDPIFGANIDVSAQSKITLPTDTSVTGRKNYTVTVTAKGPVTGLAVDPITGQARLTLTFKTDPPDFEGSQQVLQQRLANALGGDFLGQVGKNPGQALASQFTNVLTSNVLPSLFDRPPFGFDQIAVGYDAIEHFNVSISRNLFGPFYVSYTQPFDQTDAYSLKFSYRFKSRYQLSYESTYNSDQQRIQRILLEGVWKF